MRIAVSSTSPTRLEADCHVIAVWADDLKSKTVEATDLATLDRETRGALTRAIASRRFRANASEQIEASGKGGATLIFQGMGKRDEIAAKGWLTLGAKAAQATQSRRGKNLVLAPRTELTEDITRLLIEGIHLGSYHNYDLRGKGLKAQDKLPALSSITLAASGADAKVLAAATKAGNVIGEALTNAREMVNAPGNVITPTTLAAAAKKRCEAAGLTVEILKRKDLEKMGCGGILGVNQGSAEEPTMTIMRHRPESAIKGISLALVGKGVTFDTGGISLKPSKDMHHMKGDMGGAAAVIGAMESIGHLGLPIEVTGIVPSTDNMPGCTAIRPGDVITHLNGKTVEVTNTDAEGRLLLADALVYACREVKATHVVNYATLTGACVVALGERIAGVMTNDQDFSKLLCDVAEIAGEQVWPLPLNDDFTAELKSDVADLNNVSNGRWGGAETAGAFLKEFVDGPKWCHVDIAGPSFAGSAYPPYLRRGGTGFGLLMSVKLAETLAG